MDIIEEIKYVHVPYAVVLIKACEKWRADHGGQMPANFAQKQEFRSMLKAMNKFVVAENFDEALVAYTECFKKNQVLPDNISRLFANFTDEINAPTSQFWIMTKALKAFYETNNRLPVQGTIPDMISLPEYYITLQKIYLAKSDADIAIMRRYVE